MHLLEYVNATSLFFGQMLKFLYIYLTVQEKFRKTSRNFQLSQKLERKISHLCVNDLIFLKWFCFDLFYCHSAAFF